MNGPVTLLQVTQARMNGPVTLLQVTQARMNGPVTLLQVTQARMNGPVCSDQAESSYFIFRAQHTGIFHQVSTLFTWKKSYSFTFLHTVKKQATVKIIFSFTL